MAACDAKTYPDITQQIFDCFKSNAIKQGVNWQGNSQGSFSKTQLGFTVKTDYWFDASAQTFKLQVVEKPGIVTCDFLYGKFHEGLETCGASGAFPT